VTAAVGVALGVAVESPPPPHAAKRTARATIRASKDFVM